MRSDGPQVHEPLLCTFPLPALAPLLCLRHSFLHLTCEVRNNADHAFDQHELATMMHLMFFDGCDHVEAGSGRRYAALRHCYNLAEKFFGKTRKERGPLLAFLAQHVDDLSL